MPSFAVKSYSIWEKLSALFGQKTGRYVIYLSHCLSYYKNCTVVAGLCDPDDSLPRLRLCQE